MDQKVNTLLYMYIVIQSSFQLCGCIFNGDGMLCMLVVYSPFPQVKLTFQVPVVVGPKSATPPVTPTRCTPPPYTKTPPPVPPHVPLRIPLTPARPLTPVGQPTQTQDLVSMTTGESRNNLAALLDKYLFAVMYLTLSGQSENSKVSIYRTL